MLQFRNRKESPREWEIASVLYMYGVKEPEGARMSIWAFSPMQLSSCSDQSVSICKNRSRTYL